MYIHTYYVYCCMYINDVQEIAKQTKMVKINFVIYFFLLGN